MKTFLVCSYLFILHHMVHKLEICIITQLFNTLFLTEQVRADYILRVQVHSYMNPSRCGSSNCDNEFFYCLRPLGIPVQSFEDIEATADERSLQTRAAALQCMESPSAVRTQVDMNAARTRNFSGVDYLGISNPIAFEVNMKEWTVSVIALSMMI